MLIELAGVEMGFGGPPLLHGADLVIEPGSRICLLGRNGCGKSTLLRLLAGETAPDDGARRAQPGLRIGYMPQEADFGPAAAGCAGELAALGLDDEAAARVDGMLDRLAVDPQAPVDGLSGGQRRRILLARALAGDPDLLLLDEPTNHLDPDAIEWLEGWLTRSGRSVVFISHDRRFMERVADQVVELDRGRLHHSRMGYTRYLEQRAARLEDEERNRRRFEKKLAEEEAWIRQGIKARRTPNPGRVRRLQAMREEHRNMRRQVGRAAAAIESTGPSGRIVLEAEHASFGYDERDIIADLDLRVLRGDRIGITGANGAGKTTLLNLLLGRLQPRYGRIEHGTRLEIAEFDQLRSTLDPSLNAADNVAGGREYITTATGEKHVIGYLREFLFTPEQARAPIDRLSGGERARLLLARLFSRPFNLLVMDEPTNDLDLETLELLEDLLAQFDGTVFLVSHDRAFLDNVTTALLHVDGSGRVEEFSGGFTEFDRVRAARRTESAGLPPAERVEPTRQRARPAKLSYKLQRELEQLPRRIETLENDLEALQQRMSDPAFYGSPAPEIAAAGERLKQLEEELETCFARWEELEAGAGAPGR